MDKIKYRISLDMHSSVSQASLAAKQGDDNRQFSITLRSGGQPYKIERGAFAVFSTTLPDGKVIEDNCIIVDDEILYDFTQNLTSQVGVLDIEIRLYGPDSSLITSPTFILVVSPRAAKAEDITSSNSFTALDTLYGQTNALRNDMEEKLKNGYFNGEDVNYNLVSNALKGRVSGAAVTLTDVSPLEHTLKVKATGDNVSAANVVISGKNQIDFSRLTEPVTSNGITLSYIPGEDCFCLHGTQSGEPSACGVANYPTAYNTKGVVGQYYTLSFEHISGTVDDNGSFQDVNFFVGSQNTPLDEGARNWMRVCFTAEEDEFKTPKSILTKQYIGGFWTYMRNGVSFDNYKFRVQLELGETPTKHESFVEPLPCPINADGTVEVTSLYPTTILTTDTEGVMLDVEYNRDINILTKTVPLIDRVTGIPYYLYVSGGKLLIEEREV